METFANCYIFIIFAVAYAAVVIMVQRVYSLTGKNTFLYLRLLFELMILEWVLTIVYEILVTRSGLIAPRLSSQWLVYQVPKIIIKNAENALIALCLSSYLYDKESCIRNCGRPFVLVIAFTVFEMILYLFPDSNAILFVRGISDAICLMLIILCFSFPWEGHDKIFKIYACFTFIALAVIVLENFAVLYIPAVEQMIPDFYEAGDLYYFLISLLLFFGLSNVKEEYAKKKLEADLEERMELDFKNRIEKYKSDIENASPACGGIDAKYIEGFCRQYKLTKREKEILMLVISGSSNTEIAEKLFISAATVRVHQHTAFQKVGVSNQLELLGRVNDYAASEAERFKAFE